MPTVANTVLCWASYADQLQRANADLTVHGRKSPIFSYTTLINAIVRSEPLKAEYRYFSFFFQFFPTLINVLARSEPFRISGSISPRLESRDYP